MAQGIRRRSLLLGAGALALSQGLLACGGRGSASLRVLLLDGSVPPQLLREFERTLQQRGKLDFSPRQYLSELFDLLEIWHQAAPAQASGRRLPISIPFVSDPPPPVADLVTIGDYWLTAAIQQNLIQPLAVESLDGWDQVPERWQDLVRRDRQGLISSQGEVWAAPYRWGSLAIAYRRDVFDALDWVPAQWEDLWRPALAQKISLPNSPRIVIGLAAHKLGQSFNSEDPAAIPALPETLRSLHEQVKFYSSDAYLQPLLLEDTWLAVGWTTDILPLVSRDRRIAAVVPNTGTVLTADLWVRPQTASNSELTANDADALLAQWIRFCWQPEIATQLSLLSSAASPILLSLERSVLPEALQTNNLLLPDAETLRQSEFLRPLPQAATEQYRRLWFQVRQSVETVL